MLTALGYEQDVDFAYNDTLEFAAELGLGAVAEADPFTIDDLATATVEALKATPKDADETLIAQLVTAGAVDADVAESTGIYEAAVTELAVEDIEVDNLIQINVIFNEASLLDAEAAEKTDNYKLVNSDDDEIKIEAASVNGNVVTLTLEKARSQQDELVLTVKNKILPEAVAFDVEFIDTTIPTVVGAEVVGNDTIKVIFSEPMTKATGEDVNAYEVDGGDYYISSVELVNNNTEANVELYSTLEEGDVTIKVNSDVEDYAGFGVIPATKTVTVVEDDEAPVVVGYKNASPLGVTLIFNEDIELVEKGADALENFYHTNTKNVVDEEPEINGRELTLKFAEDYKMPAGVAYIYIAKDSVNDLWDNKNDKIQVKVEVELDTTKPVFDKLEVDEEDQITLTFSEAIDSDFDEDNFTLLDENGKEVKGAIKKAVAGDKAEKIVITFDEKLNGDYTLVIEDLEDLAGNVILDTTVDFTVDDMEAPLFSKFKAYLYDGTAKYQIIKLNFGEKMATDGKYSVTDLEKYSIDGKSLADDIKDVKIKVVDSGKAIEIQVPKTDGVDKNQPYFANDDVITMARVADAAGNYTKSPSGTVTIEASTHVGISKVEATATDTVVVTFGDSFKTFDVRDIKLYFGTVGNKDQEEIEIGKQRTSVNDDGNTVVTFTLKDKLDTDATKAGDSDLEVFVVVTGYKYDGKNITLKSVNKYNKTLDLGDSSAAADDKIAPKVAKVKDGDKDVDNVAFSVVGDTYQVAITFTEAIDINSVSTMSFEIDDHKITEVRQTKTNPNEVILIIDDKDGKVELGTEVVQKVAIKDSEENKVEDIKTKVNFVPAED